MIRFGWFRLLVRLAGIVLVGLALPGIAAAVAPLIYDSAAISIHVNVPYYLGNLIAPVVQFALGLYLLLGGKWLMRHCLRGIDTICPYCAYDISAVASDTCPECGFRFRIPTLEPPKSPSAP